MQPGENIKLIQPQMTSLTAKCGFPYREFHSRRRLLNPPPVYGVIYQRLKREWQEEKKRVLVEADMLIIYSQWTRKDVILTRCFVGKLTLSRALFFGIFEDME